HLTVDVHIVLLEAIDKGGVAHAVETGSSVDTGDPQTAEITLAQLAAFVGIAQRTGNLFGSGTVLLGLCAPVALGQLHHLAAFLMSIYSSLNTCHGIFSSLLALWLICRAAAYESCGLRHCYQ